MPMISLPLPRVPSWPKHNPLCVAKALTMCRAVFLPSREPHRVFPSKAIMPLATPAILTIQLRKHCSKTAASSKRKTRPKVSWEGVPFFNTRYFLSQSSLSPAHSATSTQLSAPQRTELRAMTMVSCRSWRCAGPVRGSGSIEKACITRMFTHSKKSMSGHHFFTSSIKFLQMQLP